VEAPFIRHADGSQRQGEMVKAGSGWELSIGPCDLSFLRVDHQTRLQFEETEVVIESPFVLRANGVVHHLDPGERADLGPFLHLYPDTLSSSSVDADGTLHLVFASGATLSVPPDPRYEAWQVNGPGTFLVVCVPGNSGDLAVWGVAPRQLSRPLSASG